MKTLGDNLLEARLRKGYSVNDCVEYVRIPASVINKMETDQWNRLESYENVIKYLTAYARFLTLDEDQCVAVFNEFYGNIVYEPSEEEIRIRQENKEEASISITRKNVVAFIILIVLFFIGGFIYSAYADYKQGLDISNELLKSIFALIK